MQVNIQQVNTTTQRQRCLRQNEGFRGHFRERHAEVSKGVCSSHAQRASTGSLAQHNTPSGRL